MNNSVLTSEYFLESEEWTLEELEEYRAYCEKELENPKCITKKQKKYFVEKIYPNLKKEPKQKLQNIAEKNFPELKLPKQLSNFILNDKDIYTPKNFVFDEYKGFCAFGMFLPKWVDEKVGNNKFKKSQKREPVLITSKKTLLEVNNTDFESIHKAYFPEVPEYVPNYFKWSLNSIKKYLLGKYEVKSEELFEDVEKQYKKYLYFQKEVQYIIHSLWDVGTYSFMLSNNYPLFDLWGIKGSGKSKIMQLSNLMTFNSTGRLQNPSESSLFRDTHDFRPTKYVDEAEKLFRIERGQVEGDNRTELINSSFTKGATVPRVEKVNGRFKSLRYNTYSPTMIGSIKGLFGATEDRSIIHVTVRNPNDDDRSELWPSESPIFQQIRDKCYIWTLNNYEELKASYDTLKNTFKLKNREWDIWKSIIVLSKFFCPEKTEEIVKYALEHSERRKANDINEGSWEYKALTIIKQLIEEGYTFIYVKDISSRWGSDIPNRTISKLVRQMGFAEYNKRGTGGATGFELDINIFDYVVSTINPDLCINKELPSLSSLSSLSRLKEDNNKVNLSEENKNIVKVISEDSEANEDSEEVLTREGLKNLPTNKEWFIEDFKKLTKISDKTFNQWLEEGELEQHKAGYVRVLR